MISLILECFAFVCFVFAFLGWPATPRNLVALGLALWVLGVILSGVPFRF